MPRRNPTGEASWRTPRPDKGDPFRKTNEWFAASMVRYSERMVHSIEALGVGTQFCAYLDDTYLEQVDTQVIALGERDGTPWAAVEHCLFHPQGGGQPADRGWLEDTEIIPVRDRESGLVVVMAPEGGCLPSFAEGQQVRARIDLQARTAHAALHTAGHLVEAVGRLQGWEMTGSNHFPGQARIEFQAPRTDARLDDPQDGRRRLPPCAPQWRLRSPRTCRSSRVASPTGGAWCIWTRCTLRRAGARTCAVSATWPTWCCRR